MTRPTTEEGFRFWLDEVVTLEWPEQNTPYIPAIALVGIYVAFHSESQALTCYDWRQAVLKDDYARAGYRRSLSSFFADSIDDTFGLPIDQLEPPRDAALQLKSMYQSIKNGLPESVTTIPSNEAFLAEQIGLADHDSVLSLNPLRLTADGVHAFRNFYPASAEFVSDNT